MTPFGKLEFSMPQAIVAAAALLTLGVVLVWAPADVRSTVIEWLGWGLYGVSSFAGPIVKRSEPPEDPPA